MTTIQFSDVDDGLEAEPSYKMQSVVLEEEQHHEEEDPLPNQTIPDTWRQLLTEEGVDIAGIEWWESPSFVHTIGKQGFASPMILSPLIWVGLPYLFFLAFPVDILLGSSYLDEYIAGGVLIPIFICFGVFFLLFLVLYISFLSETSFSVGGLGTYFYAATPRSFIVAYRAWPIPMFSARLPTSVTTIPFTGKYFRGDIRWNGSGGLLLPSTNMGMDQKRECLGGKGGFLYVRNMRILLSYLHSVTTGISEEVIPEPLYYQFFYSGTYGFISIFSFLLFLFGIGPFLITSFVFQLYPYFTVLLLYSLFVVLIVIVTGFYAFYWLRHAGIIHLNCPPNHAQEPVPLPMLVVRKFLHFARR